MIILIPPPPSCSICTRFLSSFLASLWAELKPSCLIVRTFYFYFLLLFNCHCPHVSPISLLCPTQPPPPIFSPPPLSLSVGPLHMFLDLTLPLLSTLIPLPTPFWLLSVCSLFPCLCFCFAHLFVLLNMFHL